MKRLKLTYKGNEIVSDIFNFKAFRMMYDILYAEVTIASLDEAALVGVIAMFDGTVITEDVIRYGLRDLHEDELLNALNKVINWFNSVTTHNDGEVLGQSSRTPILSLYNSMLSQHLPSEIDKQEPQLLLDVMAADVDDTIRADDIPEDIRVCYGL